MRDQLSNMRKQHPNEPIADFFAPIDEAHERLGAGRSVLDKVHDLVRNLNDKCEAG
jgi:hypothetical protein